jgi:hypothetical protein
MKQLMNATKSFSPVDENARQRFAVKDCNQRRTEKRATDAGQAIQQGRSDV